MTPLEHLQSAVKTCLFSHLKDLGEDREKVGKIKVKISPSENSLVIEIECDRDIMSRVQKEVVDQCYVLKHLTYDPEIRYKEKS